MHGPVPQASPPQPPVAHSITAAGTPSVARSAASLLQPHSAASSLPTPVGSAHSVGSTECAERASGASRQPALAAELPQTRTGLLCEYMGHDVSNMRGFDSYRLLTLSLAALMTRISSVVIEGAHTSAGAATLARTVPFWGRFRSPREPTAGPCRGCLLPSATNTAPSRHHLQAVLCDGWDVQTPPSWLLRPQTRELYGWS